MKNLIYTVFVLANFCFNSSTLKSNVHHNAKDDSLTCLRIEGTISNLIDDGEDCIIELVSNENGIDTIVLREGKDKFKFFLKRNSYYGIRISKKGFITKLVSVNTEMLVAEDEIHRFKFETRLLKESTLKNLNKDIVDFPIAIIHYDYENECFTYNKPYTAYIKRELHRQNSSYEVQSIASNNEQ